MPHGHTEKYKRGCVECRALMRAIRYARISRDPESYRAIQERAKHKALATPRHQVPHGATGYSFYACRCDICRSAANEKRKKWYRENPERERETQKRNRVKILAKARGMSRELVPHGLRGYRIYGCRCQTCADASRASLREWRARDPELSRKRGAAYQKKRLKADPTYKLLTNVRKRVWRVLRGGLKPERSLELVGCDLQQLRAHLEEQFARGMSWDNYGQWHVDHKRPCASFDVSDTDQLRQCFHYSNLQPLWGHDNRVKGSKI